MTFSYKKYTIIFFAIILTISLYFLFVQKEIRAEITHRVTNLNDTGQGSLRWCAEKSGARACVFDVAGTIVLSSNIEVKEPFLRILGETAPGNGITITSAGIHIATHDVVIQHIRVRPGDAVAGPDPVDRDGISIKGDSGDIHHILIDHVSVSWAIDENIDVWGSGIHDVTISNSIISEGLNESSHPKGAHSKGLLVGTDISPFPYNIFITKNLFAHNSDRNPLISNGEVVNNVIYNWEKVGTSVRGKEVGNTQPEVSVARIVGNVYISGPSDKKVNPPIFIQEGTLPSSEIIIDKNLWKVTKEKSSTTTNDLVLRRAPGITLQNDAATRNDVLPVDDVESFVLQNAGARPYGRDSVDKRIIESVRSGTGRIIDVAL